MDAESQKSLVETQPAQIDRNGRARMDQGRTLLPSVTGAAGNVLFAAIFLACLLAFYSFVYVPNHNVGGPILTARLAQALGSSFADYVSYFPPAEHVWFGTAARLSDVTSITPDRMVILMTGVAVLISSALAYRIRKQTVDATPLWFVLSVVALVVLPILVKNIFGLRVHLVVLGLWPYLNLRLCDPDDTRIGWKLRSVVGLWLGATLTLRYIFCIIVLVVELFDALTARRFWTLFRIENLIAGGIVALYLFFWLVLDPSQREVMGAMVSSVDGNLASPTTSIVYAAINFSPALLFVALTFACKLPRRTMVIGLAMIVGGIAAAWIQSRWYEHHLFPTTAAYVAWLWMIHRDVKPLWLAAMALIVAQPLLKQFSLAPSQETYAELDRTLDEAGLTVTGKRVGILNMHPSPLNQYLAREGAWRWNGGINNAYVAAELKAFDSLENAEKRVPAVKLDDPGRAMLHDEMLRLWEDIPPDVLILDERTSWPLRHLNVTWKAAFGNDPRFKAILAQYRPVFVHEGERLNFTYYVRKQAD